MIKRNIYVERRVTINLMLSMFVYSMAWMPYAFASMYRAFFDEDGIDEVVGTLPAIFAKSSTLWLAVSFIFGNQNIKNELFRAVSRTNTTRNNMGDLNDELTTSHPVNFNEVIAIEENKQLKENNKFIRATGKQNENKKKKTKLEISITELKNSNNYVK